MSDSSGLLSALRTRAGAACELCAAVDAGHVFMVGPVVTGGDPSERAVLLCDACDVAAASPPANALALRSLQEAAWSEVPAVQVAAVRLLRALPDETWAADLLGQLYLDDETLAWADADARASDEARPTLDSHGAVLLDGDSVTLIKDLEVKGAGFTAKRGTLVKGIRLTEDVELIEARVNKVAIVLKTCFLKKVH